MDSFVHCFVPIFVAMDVAGLLPVYLSLTRSLEEPARQRIGVQAIATAFIISAAFIFIGQVIFELLGITVRDFQIAGGVLLVVLAIVDMLRLGEINISHTHVGPVPLGTPLIAGPAVLTSLLVLLPLHGAKMTLLALAANLLIAMLALRFSRRLVALVSEEGMRALSQVISLFLAAIGVALIRRGLFP